MRRRDCPSRLLTRARILIRSDKEVGKWKERLLPQQKESPVFQRPFKSIIEQLGLHDEDTIMYVGLPGVCTPFVELLSYAIRTLAIKQVFVANLDLALVKTLVPVENVGIQFADPVKIDKAKVIVVLGGLAMPISPVSRDDVSLFLQRVLLPGGSVIGVCFMSMFEQVG